MSILVLAKGFTLGLSMIVPIGAQNSLILNQGIGRNYHLTTAALCALYDIVLIALGVMGGSILLSSNDMIFSLLSWGGIGFLLVYGAMAMKSAILSKAENSTDLSTGKSLKVVIMTSLIVTFLNPHAYVDTVMVLGSVGGQYQGTTKIYFMVGAMAASIVWFFSLATGAAKMSHHLSKPSVKRYIDCAIALVMWGIAYSLFNAWFIKLYS